MIMDKNIEHDTTKIYHKSKSIPQKIRIMDNDELRPLSMKSYAFSGKKLRAKMKQAQLITQEAADLIDSELGRTMHRPKKRIDVSNWRIK